MIAPGPVILSLASTVGAIFTGLSNTDAALRCASAAVLLSALLCMKRGWWPRRQGVTPHCRKCNYILAAISSSRCPECGLSFNSKTVKLGFRLRRRGMTWAGIILLLLGLTWPSNLAIARLRKVDWYDYRPPAWVLPALRSNPFQLP